MPIRKSDKRLYAQAIRRHKQGRRRDSTAVRVMRALLVVVGVAILVVGLRFALA